MLTCPKCGSDKVESIKLVEASGTVGIYRTALASGLAKPREQMTAVQLGMIVIGLLFAGFGYWMTRESPRSDRTGLYVSLFLGAAIVAAGVWSLVLTERHNRGVPARLAEWERQSLCRGCSHVFVPPGARFIGAGGQ